MKIIIATVALCLFALPSHANLNNQVIKYCLQTTGNSFDTYNFTKAAACYQDWKAGVEAEKLAELRDFLKHNPRYTVPGQSLNRCWGKPREMPFESAYIKKSSNGFEAGINYKDTIPAGCYENAPWDNRDVED
jgi:hypothetical protein